MNASPAHRARAGVRLAALLLVAGIAGAGGGPAAAGEPVRAVVELYTSQGCASCPPADRLLAELAREPGIVALTLPVTYWDYLGWKDSLGQAAFSERQRAYASARSERQVFTPQAVINGREAVVGSDRAGIERGLARARTAGGLPVAVHAEEHGERIVIGVEADPAGRTAEVWLVPVLRSRPVAIGRGENKGRVVVYANVVRGLHRVGPWSGQAARYDVPRDAARAGGADSYVVVLQGTAGGHPGRVLGAAKGPGL